MKKLGLLAVIVVALASCQEPETQVWKQQAVHFSWMLGNWRPDSIQIGNGARIIVANEPMLQDDRYFFSYNEGDGQNYGFRYQGAKHYFDTAYVPELQYFAFDMHRGPFTENSFIIGRNEVTVDVTREYLKMVQTPDPANPREQYQTIWLTKVSEIDGVAGIPRRP